LAARDYWEALDGIVWTPWHTILVAEETNSGGYPDPDYPHASSGLVYEIELDKGDPTCKGSRLKTAGLAIIAFFGSD
jgi:hypothetical protein